MFDKDLFLSLCEKYDVELSKTATSPMLKDGDQVHAITNDDVNRVFAPCQTYFDYSCNKTNAKKFFQKKNRFIGQLRIRGTSGT